MAEGDGRFDYVAFDAAGKRVRGSIEARSDASAFERLKRDGFSPLSIKPARSSGPAFQTAAVKSKTLNERESAELLSDLSALLRAGSDMRTALAIIGQKAGRSTLQATCRALSAEISGGGAMDQAFARNLSSKQGFVGALVAAGEASGDLAGGLERAAEILQSRLQIREQLVSVLSYPMFVLISTVAALGVILLLVVPSLAPLAEAPGAKPALAMSILLGISNGLRDNLGFIAAALLGLVLILYLAGRAGALAPAIERYLLDGPSRRTTRGLVFGGFAIALGNVLSAGAPMSEALRLGIRSVRSSAARKRLEPVAQAVRQGESLSSALTRVSGFPSTVVRLAAIGEASGSLGSMLARAGQMEEKAALRRIEAIGRLLGPALIVFLGAVVGLLMGGLLSGVSGLGETAIQ
jgi:type II secretory pathway component PulF